MIPRRIKSDYIFLGDTKCESPLFTQRLKYQFTPVLVSVGPTYIHVGDMNPVFDPAADVPVSKVTPTMW